MSLKFFLILILVFFTSPILSLNIVILRTAVSLRGNVIGQNADSIKLKTEEGETIEIPKKKVLKVLYKEITAKEIDEIRKKEEERLRVLQEKEREKQRLAEQKKAEELQNLKEKFQNEGNPAFPKPKLGVLSSYKLYNSYPNPVITLADPEAMCEPYAYSSDWYILFGTFRLTSPDISKLLPRESRPIQIRYETSWTDLAVTMLGGIAFSLTKKTLYVDICEEKNQKRMISEAEFKLEKEVEKKITEEFKKAREEEELEENIKLEIEIKKLEKIGKYK